MNLSNVSSSSPFANLAAGFSKIFESSAIVNKSSITARQFKQMLNDAQQTNWSDDLKTLRSRYNNKVEGIEAWAHVVRHYAHVIDGQPQSTFNEVQHVYLAYEAVKSFEASSPDMYVYQAVQNYSNGKIKIVGNTQEILTMLASVSDTYRLF